MVTVTNRPPSGAGSLSSARRFSSPSSSSQQTATKTPINTSPALNPDVRAERIAANYAAGVVSSQSPFGSVSGSSSSNVALGGYMPSQYTSSSKDGVVSTPARASNDYGQTNKFSYGGGSSFVSSDKYGAARDKKGVEAQQKAEYGNSPQARIDDRNRYLSNIQSKQALAQKVRSPVYNVATKAKFNKQLSVPLVTQPAINRVLSGVTTTKKTSTVKIGDKEVTTTVVAPSGSAYLQSTPKGGSILQLTAHNYEYQIGQSPAARPKENVLQRGVRAYKEEVLVPLGAPVAKGVSSAYYAAESKTAAVTGLLPSSEGLRTKANTFFVKADTKQSKLSAAAKSRYGEALNPVSNVIKKSGEVAATGVGFGLGYYEGVRTKPLKIAAYTAAGFVSPFVLSSAGKATVAVVGAARAAKLVKVAKVTATALGTAYIASVAHKASQTKKEGVGTQSFIGAGEVIGEKLSTEVVPIVIGAGLGTALMAKKALVKVSTGKTKSPPADTYRTGRGVTFKGRTEQVADIKVGTTTYKAKSIARSTSTYYGKSQISRGKGNIKTDILKDTTGKGGFKYQQTIKQKTAQTAKFKEDGTINIKLAAKTGGNKADVYNLNANKVMEVKPSTSGLTVTTNKVDKVYLPKSSVVYKYTGTKYTGNIITGKIKAVESVTGGSARTKGIDILKTPVTGRNKNTRVLSFEHFISTSKTKKLPGSTVEVTKATVTKQVKKLLVSKKSQMSLAQSNIERGGELGNIGYTYQPNNNPVQIPQPKPTSGIKVMPTIKQAPPTVTPSTLALNPVVRAARADIFVSKLPTTIGEALLVYGATRGAKLVEDAFTGVGLGLGYYEGVSSTKNVFTSNALAPVITLTTSKTTPDIITQPKTVIDTAPTTITTPTVETIYKPLTEPPRLTTFAPPEIPFTDLPPRDIPPLLPVAGRPFGGGFQSFRRSSRKKGKQTKRYTPTAYAAVFEIKGKASKAGTKTGFGVRPISSKKPKKIRFKI